METGAGRQLAFVEIVVTHAICWREAESAANGSDIADQNFSLVRNGVGKDAFRKLPLKKNVASLTSVLGHLNTKPPKDLP
jgi:hypothetical protein